MRLVLFAPVIVLAIVATAVAVVTATNVAWINVVFLFGYKTNELFTFSEDDHSFM